MLKVQRTLGWVALCTILAGCSGYRPLNWDPNTSPDSREDTLAALGLEEGQKVRVTTAGGTRFTGRIHDWNEESLTLIKTSGLDEGAERFVLWSHIEILETQHADTGKSAAAGGGVLLVIGLIVLAVTMASVAATLGN